MAFDTSIDELVGKTLSAVRKVDDDRLEFDTGDGRILAMYHSQDCCESVVIDDISGDLSDLVGSPILVAEERSQDTDEGIEGLDPDRWVESETWTFYTLRTIKGTVDIRWHGSSNGYYSESVYLAWTDGSPA